MRGVPLTPEQRARRAEVRRRLARKVLLRTLLGGVALALLLGVLAWWLLTTVSGRNVLLDQVVARLPADATLTWERAEGPAAGPLRLHGVRLTVPRQRDPGCTPTPEASCAMGTVVLRADTVRLDTALRPLLGRTLHLDVLEMRGAVLDLPRSDAPFEFPRWPQSLPQVALPLSLQVDALRIDDLRVRREGVPLLHVRHARGGLAASTGALHLDTLRVDSDRGEFSIDGDYLPGEQYRTDLRATAVLPPAPSGLRPRLGLVARGSLVRMDIGLGGRAPAPLRATLSLRGAEHPRWTFQAHTDAFDPGLLAATPAATTPLAVDLRARGTGGRATLSGQVRRGDLAATIRPSHLRLEDQVLELAPLRVETLGGQIAVRGRADLRDPANAALRLAIAARGLRWGGPSATGAVDRPAIVADASVGLAGRPQAWAATGTATLARGAQQAQVRLEARGDTTRATVRTLRADMGGGQLRADGWLQWSPALAWEAQGTLDDFDPGYLFPDWPGQVDGRLRSTGQARAGGGVDARLALERLGGTLRGRRLSGEGRATIAGRDVSGALDLGIGGSKVRAQGSIADRLSVDADFTPLQLADLWPGAAGTLRGTLRLRGRRDAPDVAADLSGTGLALGTYRAATLEAHGRLPWRGGQGRLVLDATGLQAGVGFDRLHAQATGAVEDLQLEAQADGDTGAIALAGDLTRRGNRWTGSLARLRLSPARGAAWQLQGPVRFGWQPGALSVGQACLASAAGGTLCASADWPRQGVEVSGRGLPLALLAPYLPREDAAGAWLPHGEVTLDGRLRPAAGGWTGRLRLSSPRGGLRRGAQSARDLVAYRDLAVTADASAQRLQLQLQTALEPGGRLDARVDTGWDPQSPLDGRIDLALSSLTWMELLSPDLVDPRGRLQARIGLGGTRASPAIDGQARLDGFVAELPALGITLREGQVQLDARADGSARVRGSVRSGEGALTVDGTLDWRGGDAPLALQVGGRNVLVADTRDLRAVVDPDLAVRYGPGEPLQVTGTVSVPSARLDLERLDRGVSRSPDVVVLDPVDPGRKAPVPLDLDLTLVLGEQVRLSGFGLDGGLDGRLRVRQRPGREMLATGALSVSGRYTAYGQKLSITRGGLSWSNGPIANPVLDVRAERQVGDVTAGIQVRGRATAPQAEVWSDPAMSDSEALSYLALGRPLIGTSASEAQQLSAASAALSAGGSLLASQLGTRLGLDDAGTIQSRTLGGNVFGVGKYLSPRLYVSYGVSLLGTGQVLALKYLLRKGFFIEIESSTVENRASVNWRKEK